MKKKNRIRLFIDTALKEGFELGLNEAQGHYLFHVMKLGIQDEILAFNGKDGEFLCRITAISKKTARVRVEEKTREFSAVPDIFLLFAPVKKDQTDYIIQKATELGAKALIPVITERTITDKTRTDRFNAQAVEAAEQSRRVDIPEVFEAVPLQTLLDNWNPERTLFFMDETGNGAPILKSFTDAAAEKIEKAAILTGPEGGFSDKELMLLRQASFARGVSMGKRILRAETAAAAALACWQAAAGDWREG